MATTPNLNSIDSFQRRKRKRHFNIALLININETMMVERIDLQ
nr:hypothetical protein [Longitalea luteola]